MGFSECAAFAIFEGKIQISHDSSERTFVSRQNAEVMRGFDGGRGYGRASVLAWSDDGVLCRGCHLMPWVVLCFVGGACEQRRGVIFKLDTCVE